jgi:tRNA G18 (ribose-2'-O)-methylase SpoU
MFHVRRIVSLDLPELTPYRCMKRPLEQANEGIFVAESDKVVRRLLESKLEVVSVLLPEKWIEAYSPLLDSRPENVPVYVVDHKDVLEKLVGFSMFQGIMAVGRIPAPVTLESALSESGSPRLFVALDELANAENLGVLVRNCVAFGVDALIAGETSSSPYLRRAVRNSMGAIFQLPVVELRRFYIADILKGESRRGQAPTVTLAKTLRQLRDSGFACIAAHPHATGRIVSQADFTGDCCIVFGSEADGISPEVLASCDEAVAIPMPPNVDSLNVSNAAAVFLYEVCRQRAFACQLKAPPEQR